MSKAKGTTKSFFLDEEVLLIKRCAPAQPHSHDLLGVYEKLNKIIITPLLTIMITKKVQTLTKLRSSFHPIQVPAHFNHPSDKASQTQSSPEWTHKVLPHRHAKEQNLMRTESTV